MASKAAKDTLTELLIDVTKLVPWKGQPRKSADTEGLASLSKSLIEQGQLQALIVRPAKKSTFEVICGERRLHAAKKAKLVKLRVVVRENLVDNDDLAREVALTENLQREDLPPLEEADGIAALRDRGKSVEEIATKLGRSPGYVYRRLALCELGEKARKALVVGDLMLGAAEVLATVPKGGQQDAALRDLGRYTPPWSRGAAHSTVHGFRLQLVDARWQLDDATLVPKAGPCSSCKKRSGAQPALFEDDAKDAKDRCLDPECFESKKTAHAKRMLEAAKKDGLEILSATDAKKLFPSRYSRAESKEFVDLDAGSGYYGDGKKWSAVLGKKRLPADVTLAVNPHTGDVVRLVKQSDVRKALAADPKDSDPTLDRPSGGPGGRAPNAAEKKRKLVSKAKATAHKRAAEELREKLAQPLTGGLSELLVLVGAGVLERMYYGEPIERCAARRGWTKGSDDEPRDVMLRAIAGSPEQMTAVIVELLVEAQLQGLANGREGDDPESFVARVMAYVGVDWLAHEKTALEELEARRAKKKGKKAKKKAGKASKKRTVADDLDDYDRAAGGTEDDE